MCVSRSTDVIIKPPPDEEIFNLPMTVKGKGKIIRRIVIKLSLNQNHISLRKEEIAINFKDIPVTDLTEDEKNLIRLFRNKNGQGGIYYGRNHLEFSDGITTTWIESDNEFLINCFSKLVNWEDDDCIDYLRNRRHKIAKDEKEF